MSLKFKNILDNHCISIQDLADKVYVTAQTVRNWIRKDGTIPTIDYIYDIANILEEQPVTIAKAFIDRPDELPSDEQEFQLHDHSDWFLPSDYKYQPEILADFLKYKGISGSGVMIYKNVCWPFISVTKAVSNIVTIKYDYEDSMYQKVRDFLIHTHDCIGFVFTDKYANLISFGTDQIDWWKILSDNYGSTNLEMSIKVPIFEEMKSELVEKQKCIIRISILNEKDQHAPNSFFLKEPKDVIKYYMRDLRGVSISQKDFASAVNSWLMDDNSNDIDQYTISKWENGKVMPTLKQMYSICLLKNLSFERLLECCHWKLYRKGFLSPQIQSYTIGLNKLFCEVEDTTSFQLFMKSFLITYAASQIPLYIPQTDDYNGIRMGYIAEIDNHNDPISVTYDITNILMYRDYFEIVKLTDQDKHESITINYTEFGIYADTDTAEMGIFSFYGRIRQGGITIKRYRLELNPWVP